MTGTIVEHVHVVNYWRGGELTRAGNEYFVDLQKVTLKEAFLWFVRMEEEPDGNGNVYEQHRFLNAVAKLLK